MQVQPCYRCGGTNRFQSDCNFKTVHCHLCGNLGHIAKVCHSKHESTCKKSFTSKASTADTKVHIVQQEPSLKQTEVTTVQ